MTEGVVHISTNSINDLQHSGMVIMSTVATPVINTVNATTTFKCIPGTYATIQTPKFLPNGANNVTYMVRTAPPTTYIRIQNQGNVPVQIYRPAPPFMQVIQCRPGPIVVRSPPKLVTQQRAPVIRVIQPVNIAANNLNQMKYNSPIKPLTNNFPRKDGNPPREYPGIAKNIFDCSHDRSARCAVLDWKKFREEYKLPDPANNNGDKLNNRMLKPWDTRYQPMIMKQRAARTYLPKLPEASFRQASCLSLNSNMGMNGPHVERNFLCDFKRKQKRKRLHTDRSDDHPGLYLAKKELQKKKESLSLDYSAGTSDSEWGLQRNQQRYAGGKVYKPRTKKGEYLQTLGKRGLGREDFIYLQIAANSFLEKAKASGSKFVNPASRSVNNVKNLYHLLEPEIPRELKVFDTKTKAFSFEKSLALSVKRAVAADMVTVKKFKKPRQSSEGKTCYFDDPEIAELEPNPTGCARSEPFKRKVVPVLAPTEGRQFTTITEEDEKNLKAVQERTKQERHMTRHILTLLQNEAPDIAKLDIFKSSTITNGAKLVKHARSPIHGGGLFALEDIEPDKMIIEYVGEKIRHLVADLREKKYEDQGIDSSYMFRLDNQWVIDATKKGNLARYINHCCAPNCYARIMSRGGIKRIFIFSKFFIEKGEELTYDYKFPLEETKIECRCGAKTCRNFLN